MSRAKRTSPTADRSWWVAEGDEECPHCEQTYAYEAEGRCVRCDAAICPHCVARAGSATLCPECAKGRR